MLPPIMYSLSIFSLRGRGEELKIAASKQYVCYVCQIFLEKREASIVPCSNGQKHLLSKSTSFHFKYKIHLFPNVQSSAIFNVANVAPAITQKF